MAERCIDIRRSDPIGIIDKAMHASEECRNQRSALPDLAWLAPGFAIGSKPYAHQRDAVVASGIGTVVTLEEPSDEEVLDWGRRGVSFVALPTGSRSRSQGSTGQSP